ncbi:hypothetical protein [Nocardia tengchongensis]|uniref:hypothetical protein n=1 Tax=Nocardia tengchongensis TaxID=2055889 RepID=UPI0036C5FCBA
MNYKHRTLRAGLATLAFAAALATAAGPATADILLETPMSPSQSGVATDNGQHLLPISSGSSAPCLFTGCVIGGPSEYS